MKVGNQKEKIFQNKRAKGREMVSSKGCQLSYTHTIFLFFWGGPTASVLGLGLTLPLPLALVLALALTLTLTSTSASASSSFSPSEQY